jgi:hypothetical protein
MKEEEGATAASTAIESTGNNLIYGDLHLPPSPQPPELHEAEEKMLRCQIRPLGSATSLPA